jgi:hypothetical protein
LHSVRAQWGIFFAASRGGRWHGRSRRQRSRHDKLVAESKNGHCRAKTGVAAAQLVQFWPQQVQYAAEKVVSGAKTPVAASEKQEFWAEKGVSQCESVQSAAKKALAAT